MKILACVFCNVMREGEGGFKMGWDGVRWDPYIWVVCFIMLAFLIRCGTRYDVI